MLDVWPALPIALSGGYDAVNGIENTTAALEHNDRRRKLAFENVSDQLLEGFAAVPPHPFTVLTFLRLESSYESLPVLHLSRVPHRRSLPLICWHCKSRWRCQYCSRDLPISPLLGYSTFWIHFARDSDHLPVSDVQRHHTSPLIPFPPILPQPSKATSTSCRTRYPSCPHHTVF